MSDIEHRKWTSRWGRRTYSKDIGPRDILRNWVHSFPRGRALDIACGSGRNALYLADSGFTVDAIDISLPALKLVGMGSYDRGTSVNLILADLDKYTILPNIYDLISCTFYLNRDIVPNIRNGLKPGGFIVYEQHYLNDYTFPLGFKLKPKELLGLFKGFDIKFFSEVTKEEDDKDISVSSLVAQKPIV
jgi:SAM-dependent methyltransferase